jgi:hypothetical protein
VTLRDFALLSRDLIIAGGLLVWVFPVVPWALIICKRFAWEGFFPYLAVAALITVLVALPLILIARILRPIGRKGNGEKAD